MCGGFGGAKMANEDVQVIAAAVKDQAETRLNSKFDMFVAHSYKTQVVAGTNYSIKVQVGETQYIHIKVFKPLPCYGETLELTNVEDNQTIDSAL